MYNPISSIIRKIYREEPLNILTASTHERYETGLCMTGHNFYAYWAEGIKTWNENYGKIPDNYIILPPEYVPNYVDFDLVLSQNKFGQFQRLAPLAAQMHIPLVSLEHTLPMPQWSQTIRTQLKEARGHINVFISEYSLKEWQWDDRNDTVVIHHMVDDDLFIPNNYNRENHILSVVNDWKNRDWCCNFKGWQRITKDLPVRVIGDTPGLSNPSPSIESLVNEYQTSSVFLNTSTISPVPTALLEAMSCGAACVSTATCMIPEIITDGVNGFISNDENELRKNCKLLLDNPELARKIGQNARLTILEKFNKERFISDWNNVFWSVL